MAIKRRQFLLWAGGSAAGAVIFSACGIPERELFVESPVTMPEDLVTGRDNWYATLCAQCRSSEGIIVRVMEGRAKKVEGNPDYPINTGKQSARCEAGLQALYHPDRITRPMRRIGKRGSGLFEGITWGEALDELAAELRRLKDREDTDTVMLITQPLQGHLGLVVDRFVSGYGGHHMAFEALEETVLRTAMKRLFGQDRLPDFDIENTCYLISFGADFLGTWISPVRYARGYGEFRQGNGERGTFVQVDPRFSMTAASADEWVPVRPGYEGVLALSMAQVIISEGLGDASASQVVLDAVGTEALEQASPERTSDKTGVPPERVREMARAFATQRPSLAIGGGSTAAHTNGLFNMMAIYALNLLVDSVGKPGGIIFNPASPLPHIPSARAATFDDWQGFSDRLRYGRPKPINLLLVRGANPVHGLPMNVAFKDSLSTVGRIVSFASIMDDTAAMADLILPEHVYLEDWGDDVPDPAPGYQTWGLQQPVVRPVLDTKGFGDVLLTLAQELGIEQALPWRTFRDVLREGAQQVFAMNQGSVKATSFEAFWNGLLQRGGWWNVQTRGSLSMPAAPALARPADPSFSGSEPDYPFHLIPFSSLSLNDGQGAHLPWLQATPDPMTTATWHTWVEINAGVAKKMGIREGDVLTIESPNGTIEAPAYPHFATAPDVVSIPVGQGHTSYGRYAEQRGANVFAVLSPLKDQETGALAWAATRVRIRKTGRWIRLPKFEGSVDAILAEDAEIVQVTGPV